MAESEATLETIQKTLNNFIEEVRTDFSNLRNDREHDYHVLEKINQNVISLEGKVENLAYKSDKLGDGVKQEVGKAVTAMGDKVDEIQEEIAPKKIIVKEVKHFSLRLWFKNLLKRA